MRPPFKILKGRLTYLNICNAQNHVLILWGKFLEPVTYLLHSIKHLFGMHGHLNASTRYVLFIFHLCLSYINQYFSVQWCWSVNHCFKQSAWHTSPLKICFVSLVLHQPTLRDLGFICASMHKIMCSFSSFVLKLAHFHHHRNLLQSAVQVILCTWIYFACLTWLPPWLLQVYIQTLVYSPWKFDFSIADPSSQIFVLPAPSEDASSVLDHVESRVAVLGCV